MFRRLALFSLAIAALGAPAAQAGSAAAGKAIAREECARCHAVGLSGRSPHRKAPPLRVIARKYDVRNLEEAFAEGVVVSHRETDMPPFEMDSDKIDDLIAYLRTLRRK